MPAKAKRSRSALAPSALARFDEKRAEQDAAYRDALLIEMLNFDPMDDEAFSDLISRGLAYVGNQTEFAELVGVSYATLNRWAKGAIQPNPDERIGKIVAMRAVIANGLAAVKANYPALLRLMAREAGGLSSSRKLNFTGSSRPR